MKKSIYLFFLSFCLTCALSTRTLQEYADKNTIKIFKYTESNVEKYDEGDLSIGAMGLADFMIDLSEKDLTDLKGISQLRVKDTKGKMKGIQEIDRLLLYLERNELTQLPAEIGDMANVTVIFAKENRLSELPDEITLLKDLKAIYLDKNVIETFPPQFFKFAQFIRPNLIKIGLSSNKIKVLPDNIGDLAPLGIYHFNLANNELEEVPSSIGELKGLRVLHLDGNHLKKIPDTLGDTELTNKLYLNDNELTKIPNLSKLRVEIIYLQNNHLTTLPETLANIKELKKLYIQDNPIKSIPSKLKNKKGLKIID